MEGLDDVDGVEGDEREEETDEERLGALFGPLSLTDSSRLRFSGSLLTESLRLLFLLPLLVRLLVDVDVVDVSGGFGSFVADVDGGGSGLAKDGRSSNAFRRSCNGFSVCSSC